MDPTAIDQVERVPHGGTTDRAVLDFSANVNPEIPPGTKDVYADALDGSRRYPDDTYDDFRAAAAAYLECPTTAVIPTAGGLAGLRLALATVVDRGETVAVPNPGFGEYTREIELQGGVPEPVAEEALVSVDPARYSAIILCNPNNPTGRTYSHESLLELADRCRESETTLIVDEAFLGFTDRPSLAMEPGTIVVRSLTKLFGLPGLRAGFVVAPGADARRIARARQTWNLATPAAAVGTHVMGQAEFVNRTRRRVRRERRRMVESLQTRFTIAPSIAPFLLLTVHDGSVDDLLEETRRAGVVIRDARTFDGLDRHVRIAIRRPGENDRLLSALGVPVTDGDGDGR